MEQGRMDANLVRDCVFLQSVIWNYPHTDHKQSAMIMTYITARRLAIEHLTEGRLFSTSKAYPACQSAAHFSLD